MIELYTWSTPNGRKVSIMLEECALPYNVHKINIGTNREQFAPEYLKINPNGKIPSIVDPDGPDGKPISMMESGAILVYLADKTGRFFPQKSKYQVLQWLMFQMGGVGPMFGQAHHFMRAKKDEIPYGSERYGNEAKRLYGVMDRQLQANEYLSGAEYAIAIIRGWRATVAPGRPEPSVKRWYDARAAPGRGQGDGSPRCELKEGRREHGCAAIGLVGGRRTCGEGAAAVFRQSIAGDGDHERPRDIQRRGAAPARSRPCAASRCR
jgi:GST-like protein